MTVDFDASVKEKVLEQIEASIHVKQQLIATELDSITEAGMLLSSVFRSGGKLLICGNGGSAADAQHIATELIIRYKAENRRPSLPAISLAADSSALTAGANDFGFDKVFARQVEGLGSPGDGLLAITTSGSSLNIIEAIKAAKGKAMRTVLLTGGSGGKLFSEHKDKLDVLIRVPSEDTARIQESHIMIGQIICSLIEKELFSLD